MLFSATAVAEALPGMNAAPAVASTDLNGFSKDGSLALVRITSSEDPFTEQAADTIPEIRELARRYDPQRARRRPDGRDPRLDGRPRRRRPQDRPDRARR